MRGIAVLLALALLWAAWHALQRGRAELIANDVEMLLQEWSSTQYRSGVSPATASVRAASVMLDDARAMDARNAHVAELTAQVRSTVSIEGSAVTGFDKRALADFAKAVAMLPSSPYTWSNFAWAKYQAGQIDHEMTLALTQAARLGPWERAVQLQVVDLGFALWTEIPPALQYGVISIANNAARYAPDDVLAIAARRGRMTLVCGFERTATSDACKMIEAAANG